MPEVKYYDFPDMRSRHPDPQVEIDRLEAAIGAGLISSRFDLTMAANYEHLRRKGMQGFPPTAAPGRAKTWYTYYGAFTGVVFERDANGDPVTVPYSDSIPGLQWTSRELQDFYKSYGPAHFGNNIPSLRPWLFDAAEAARFELGDGPFVQGPPLSGVDFPLVKVLGQYRSNWPPNVGVVVRFGKWLQWFFLSEYKLAHPITTTVTIPLPYAIPAKDIVDAARSIIDNPNLTDEIKAAELDSIVTRAKGVQSTPWQQIVPPPPAI